MLRPDVLTANIVQAAVVRLAHERIHGSHVSLPD
jgi:hypothetical protein